MPVYINETFPNDKSMDIILGELNWKEDPNCVYADGVLGYEISGDFELAVFQNDKCVVIKRCADLDHAKFTADAYECEALRNQARGENWRGVKGALIHAQKR